MTQIQTVNIGATPNDGTGDPIRSAFSKINSSLKSLRSDFTTAPKVVLLGDSQMAQNTDVGSDKNCYHGPRGFFSWLQVRLGFPFNFDVSNSGSTSIIGDNKGVGGDTTTLMLARLQNDVLARNPDIVFVMGGVNDIGASANYATITGNLSSIYSQILDQGAIVVAMPILPRGSGSDWGSAAARQLHHAVNQWIRDKALSTQGIVLFDPYPILVDPTTANGDVRTNFTIDGLHPSPIGGFHMSTVGLSLFSPLVRPCRNLMLSPSDTYDATNNPYGSLAANGLLTGTSGTAGAGASGNVATSWQAFRNAGSDATITCSKTTRSDGMLGDVQQLVIATTGGGAGTGQIYFTTSPTTITSGVANGAWYEAACEIDVAASTGADASFIESVYLELWDTTTGGSKTRCLQPYSGTKFPNAAWNGVLKTPVLQTVGTTGLRIRLVIEVNETVTDSFTVKVSRVSLRPRVRTPVF